MGTYDLIPESALQKCAEDYKAISNSINLHFSSHTSEPELDSILKSASNLLNRTVNTASVETILAVKDDLFLIGPSFRKDSTSRYTINYNDLKSNTNFDFKSYLRDWCTTHPDTSILPRKSLNTAMNAKKSKSLSLSSIKVSQTKNINKVAKELKNDSSKFQFKVKNETVQRLMNNGLSLLERIRLKEQKKSGEVKDPKKDYEMLIRGKLAPVYAIIFQNYDAENKPLASFPLNQYLELIQDSLQLPVTKDDIKMAIEELLKCLGTEKVQIVSRGGYTVLKVNKLSRTEDLAQIKSYTE